MTLGKMTTACWVLFGVMCIGFLPVAVGVYAIPGLPGPVRLALAVIVVVVVWWGPFVYGMYLAQVAMGNGDRRLLKRGIRGTALVMEAGSTRMTLGGGSRSFGVPVYRYHLRVDLPGKEPYETYCMIAADGVTQGQTVDVAASPHNRKRVTIDVGQGSGKGYVSRPGGRKGVGRVPQPGIRRGGIQDTLPAPSDGFENRGRRIQPPTYKPGRAGPDTSGGSNADRLRQLAELGKLHRDGVLTDAEFAAEKARILDQ
jgi:Short C-terminal domain